MALSIALIVGPIADALGKRFKIVSIMGGRRVNDADARGVSKLGGLVIFASFTVTVLVAQVLPVPRLDPYETVRLAGLLIGGVVIFVVGLLDDIYQFKALSIFTGQSIAAGIAILFQIFIEFFNNPLTGEQTVPWAYIVTVTLSYFWLVGMMNTVNFLDGLDGLAGGVAFIAGTMLFVNSALRVEPAQTSVSLLMLALMGASLGFVLYNFYPARIIMGGGAFYLGYLLGTLSIIGGAKMAAILLVMGLPLMDLVWQAVNRLRRGRSPFEGDRGHVHFRLQDMGFNQRQIVVGYYIFCAFFGVLTLVTESQLFKFVTLGVMLILVAIGFGLLARSNQAGSSKS
ncbi:MAG: undecaprenyl/decaprenyl-phosphate alpha-N-acetylglucosaminyl 1-phosphate transferase [Chloroflexi bacterium]|nr:undecaprenyl/decaprenyl-phosphate alpha-N-acetylglucosaminyl 1-phosphate transferase [Chloroflexota bacterium]MCC6891249.1 undecaprenyl/decaprenyl-phosphate alpha-N-acetylglucosaminyl 1-phosphate transferase [Anaerolineae bacterium]